MNTTLTWPQPRMGKPQPFPFGNSIFDKLHSMGTTSLVYYLPDGARPWYQETASFNGQRLHVPPVEIGAVISTLSEFSLGAQGLAVELADVVEEHFQAWTYDRGPEPPRHLLFSVKHMPHFEIVDAHMPDMVYTRGWQPYDDPKTLSRDIEQEHLRTRDFALTFPGGRSGINLRLCIGMAFLNWTPHDASEYPGMPCRRLPPFVPWGYEAFLTQLFSPVCP